MGTWIKTYTAVTGCEFIKEASGEKITASKLKVGQQYTYKDPYKYRLIVEIDGDDVFYEDRCGGFDTINGSCSKSHFVRMCPYEATPEEVKFIDKWWKRP